MRTPVSLRAKIAVMGEPKVGRTALIRRFVFGTFEEEEAQSFGTKVSKIEIIVPYGSDLEVHLVLSIFDAAGRAGLADVHKETFFYDCEGLIAVCDVTRRDTLDALHNWIAVATSVSGEVPKIIMVNKKDVMDQARISEGMVMRAADILECPYAFVSAQTGEFVDDAFNILIMEIVERQMRELETRQIEENLKTQLLRFIVRRGRLGTNKQDLFMTFKGARYDEIEREVDKLEREGLIQIFWRGPAEFTLFPTQEGDRAVRLGNAMQVQ